MANRRILRGDSEAAVRLEIVIANCGCPLSVPSANCGCPLSVPGPFLCLPFSFLSPFPFSFLIRHTVLKSPHPSPLSATTGFFGSRPFSAVNAALEAAGRDPIDWCLPTD